MTTTTHLWDRIKHESKATGFWVAIDDVRAIREEAIAAERARWSAFADENGEPRKVLQPFRGPIPWHLTGDGAIVPSPYTTVFSYETRGNGFTGRVISLNYSTYWDRRWDESDSFPLARNAPDGKWNCYSTRESALAAREGKR